MASGLFWRDYFGLVENAEDPRLRAMSAARQDHLACSRGDNAGRVHTRFNGLQRSSAQARADFHTRKRASLASSTKQAARSRDGDVKPREYNFDANTGKFNYVSEKGGKERHHIHLGSTDEQGGFAALKEEIVEGERIISVRFHETDKSTASGFIMPGEAQATDIEGFFIGQLVPRMKSFMHKVSVAEY